ncbi:MAG: dihydrolipoyl dehydrogenase [Alphaproteobacteria bacterium]
MTETNFDIVIVGGGPGGYVAAIRAAQLGFKAAVVEKEHLGGICLNWGCIPTKALLRSAEIKHFADHAENYGLKIEKVDFDLAKIVGRSRKISKKLSMGIKHLLKKNKVTVFDGHGQLAGKGKLSVEAADGTKTTLEARHIILATGARARVLLNLEPDGKFIWSYKEAMVPEEMPKSMLVMGSGAIGIEFANFYHTMGAEVTVVELMDRILPVEDAEISGIAQKAFEKRGLGIKTKTTVKSLVKNENDVTVTLECDGKTEEITVERVISAVGIVGNVENLGLEGTKVEVDRSHILTNEYCETGEEGVYAIGDITAPPWLAHKASHEGVICVEKIAQKEGIEGAPAHVHTLETRKIPGCTYCHPQIASVGLTEAKALEGGYEIRVGRFPFMGNGKAVALGETDGIIKTIIDKKTGELLGAHMIGAEVTEMIQGYVVAMNCEATESELMNTVFPHPTLSEMMHESVLDAFDKALHV